jgi:hypothetical protein
MGFQAGGKHPETASPPGLEAHYFYFPLRVRKVT